MKKKEKYIAIIFLTIHCSLFAFNVSAIGGSFGSYLFDNIVIKGFTNVNEFQLVYSEESFSSFNVNDTSVQSKLRVSIPASKFKADSKLMKKDFLELINADEHPFIKISLGDKQFSRELLNDSIQTNHSIRITLNGVTNIYDCISKLNKSYYNEWELAGKLKIRLTDFGINPPEKFFGVIKVKDEVFITFRILFLLEKDELENEI